MNRFFKMVLIIVLIYISVLFLAFLLQTSLIFFPTKVPQDFMYRSDVQTEEVFLETSDNEKINGLFFHVSNKVILYFHGNAGSLDSWQSVYDQFSESGYSFFIIDYRGYGKSTGSISENGLHADALAAYEYLLKRGFKENDIVIYGRSLGTGVAVQLASTRAIGGLILETPYVTMRKLVTEKVPFLLPALYLKYRFNNIDKINQVNAPLLVIHGDNDTTIPYRHGKILFDSFNGKKEMVSIKGGTHNDLDDFPGFRVAIAKFLGDLQ